MIISKYLVKEQSGCSGCSNESGYPEPGRCVEFGAAREKEGLPSCLGGFVYVEAPATAPFVDNPNDYSAITVEIDKLKLKFENAVLMGDLAKGLEYAMELRVKWNEVAVLLAVKQNTPFNKVIGAIFEGIQ